MRDRNSYIDITTTAVGRNTLVTAYESFLRQVQFDGQFRFIVTFDPAYGVDADELAGTKAFVEGLPRRFSQVHEVVIDEFPRQIGQAAALSVLQAHSRADVGVHLEDDWEVIGPVDLNGLIEDLYHQESTQIVLTNDHVARGGTFERDTDVETVANSSVPLVRLAARSWAAHYMPLCPHVHRRDRWAPFVARALALTDNERCTDERIRERLIADEATASHNVLWTRDVVVHEIGRRWLAERQIHKAITPRQSTGLELERVLTSPRSTPIVLDRSFALRAKADPIIPGLTQTFHKRPENFAEGEYPVYLERGSGAVVWDVDSNPYIDFVCALGAATLGHDHPTVSNTVRERVGRGVLLSLPTPTEITAAELLIASVPGVENVRFLKTGAEACSAAVRLARHLTRREHVLIAGYHGWHDQLGSTDSGIPKAVSRLSKRFNLDSEVDDARFLDAVAAGDGRIAAVLLSSPYHRMISQSFLRELRRLCNETGCLLVLDEIVTGFRLAPGGLGELLDIQADILCFSKGMAAGMPLAAIAGPARVMAELGRLRISTTFGGELLSLEVMKAVMREYARGAYYEHISQVGATLRERLNTIAVDKGLAEVIVGYDPMPCLQLSSNPQIHQHRARVFLAEMARRGVLLRRDVNFICAAHTSEHVDLVVEAADEALEVVIKSASEPQP